MHMRGGSHPRKNLLGRPGRWRHLASGAEMGRGRTPAWSSSGPSRGIRWRWPRGSCSSRQEPAAGGLRRRPRGSPAMMATARRAPGRRRSRPWRSSPDPTQLGGGCGGGSGRCSRRLTPAEMGEPARSDDGAPQWDKLGEGRRSAAGGDRQRRRLGTTARDGGARLR